MENNSVDDNPFNSDTGSEEEEIEVKEEKSEIQDPTITQLNRKLLKDIRNLSIHDENNYDPSYDILHIEDPSLLDESSLDESNKTAYKDDMVYLSNIYDLYNKMSTKIDDMMNKMYVEKRIINDIHRDALEDNMVSIKQRTKEILTEDEVRNINFLAVKSIIEDFPTVIKEIETNLADIEEIKKEYDIYIKKHIANEINIENEVEKVKVSISNKLRDFALVFNGINSSYQIGSKSNESGNSSFRFEDGDGLLNSIVENFIKINNENNKLNGELNTLKNDKDINSLTKIVESNKKTIKKLQDENVSFSEAVNKLNEINIKLKKECVLISSEYKKLIEINKERKRTIDKQKKVIELLQSKLGENCSSPIDEIKLRMGKLKTEMEREKDQEKQKVLKKNYDDTERRLKDFESINKK